MSESTSEPPIGQISEACDLATSVATPVQVPYSSTTSTTSMATPVQVPDVSATAATSVATPVQMPDVSTASTTATSVTSTTSSEDTSSSDTDTSATVTPAAGASASSPGASESTSEQPDIVQFSEACTLATSVGTSEQAPDCSSSTDSTTATTVPSTTSAGDASSETASLEEKKVDLKETPLSGIEAAVGPAIASVESPRVLENGQGNEGVILLGRLKFVIISVLLLIVAIYMSSVLSCESHQFRQSTIYGFVPVCKDVKVCGPKFYEHTVPSASTDRRCEPINPAKDIFLQLLEEDLGKVPDYLNTSVNPQLQNLLLFQVLPEEMPKIIVKHTSVFQMNSAKDVTRVLFWMTSYVNVHEYYDVSIPIYQSLFQKCDGCKLPFRAITHSLANWFEVYMNQVGFISSNVANRMSLLAEVLVFLEKSQPALDFFAPRVRHVLNESLELSYYQRAREKLENILAECAKHVHEADFLDAETQINTHRRRNFFTTIFSNADLVLQLEQLLKIPLQNVRGQQTRREVESKINSLKRSVTTILGLSELTRNDAAFFDTLYRNLVTITDLCKGDFKHFGCFHQLQSIQLDVIEKAKTTLILANSSIDDLDFVAMKLGTVQLLLSFIPNEFTGIRGLIERFLVKFPIENILNLHTALRAVPEGLGEELINDQPYFVVIQGRIRQARATQGLSDTLGSLKISDDDIFVWKQWRYGLPTSHLRDGYHEYLSTFKSLIVQEADGVAGSLVPLYVRETAAQFPVQQNTESSNGVFEISSVESVNKLQKSIVEDLKTHIKRKCIIKGAPGKFYKACVPKAIAYLTAYWSTLPLSRISKFPARTYLSEPYNAQIITMLRLLDTDANHKVRSHLAQVGTGEGKSLDLAVIGAFLALVGADVHIVCYSPYLTSRDGKDFEEFYVGLGVREKVNYRTIDELADYVVKAFADPQSFIEGGFSQSHTTSHSLEHSYLLLDEVDVFFNKRFYGDTFNMGAVVKVAALKQLALKIWQNEDLSLEDVLASSEFKAADAALASFPPALLKNAVKKMVFDARNFGEHSYVVQDGKIGYVDLDSYNFDHFHIYKTLFAYVIEHLKSPNTISLDEVAALRIACGRISYAELPLYFNAVLGVSATLEKLHPEEKALLDKKYKIERTTIVPSMFARAVDYDFKESEHVFIVPDETFNVNLAQLISDSLNGGKGSVVVVFDTMRALLDFFQSETYHNQADLKKNTRFFTEASDEADRALMPKRTNANQITLITRAYGRGVDFSCYDLTVNSNKGVVVIQTFLSSEPSEITQIQGRAGRQGQRGAYRLILKKEEELMGKYGWSKEAADQCKSNCYEQLLMAVSIKYAASCTDKALAVASLGSVHNDTMQFLEHIASHDVAKVSEYVIKNNEYLDSSAASSMPLHTVFCIDSSASMGFDESHPWNQAVEAVKYVLQSTIMEGYTDDVVSFVIYDHEVKKVVEKIPIDQAMQTINRILVYFGGGTEFGQPIVKAHEILNKTDAGFRMKFLFLSDGDAASGGPEMIDLGNELGPKGLKTFVFAFGKDANTDQLKTMVTLHGNGAEFLDVQDIGKASAQPKLAASVKEQMDRFITARSVAG